MSRDYIIKNRGVVTNSKMKDWDTSKELFVKKYIDETDVEEEPYKPFILGTVIEAFIKAMSPGCSYTEEDFYKDYYFDDGYVKEDLALLIRYKENVNDTTTEEWKRLDIARRIYEKNEHETKGIYRGQVKTMPIKQYIDSYVRTNSLEELRVQYHGKERWQQANNAIKITPAEKKMLEGILKNLWRNNHLSHIDKEYYHSLRLVGNYTGTRVGKDGKKQTGVIKIGCELDRMRLETKKGEFVKIEQIKDMPLSELKDCTLWVRDYKSTSNIEKCEYEVYEGLGYANQVSFYTIVALVSLGLVEAAKKGMKIKVILDFVGKTPQYAYEPRMLDKARVLDRVNNFIKPTLDEIAKYMTTGEIDIEPLPIESRKDLYRNPLYPYLDCCVLKDFNQFG